MRLRLLSFKQMGLELERPRKSSIGGKWGGQAWDQKRG